MDKFRKQIKNRIIPNLISAICGVTLLIVLLRQPAKLHIAEFIKGFQTGILISVIGICIFYIIRAIRVLKDDEKLKQLHIDETDERKLLVQQKANSMSMIVTTFVLVGGTAISGFFNETIFFTLLATCVVILIPANLLKLYYSKKY